MARQRRYTGGWRMVAVATALIGVAVGALLDLGVPLADVQAVVRSLGLDDCELGVTRMEHGAIDAAKFEVRTTQPQPERTFPTIRSLLERGALPPRVRERAIETFRVL